MAIPLLAPVASGLSAALGALLSKLADIFINFGVKKYLRAVVAISFLITLMVGLMTTYTAIINSIQLITPPYLTIAASWVVPNNLARNISFYIAARIALWGWHMNKFAVDLKVKS